MWKVRSRKIGVIRDLIALANGNHDRFVFSQENRFSCEKIRFSYDKSFLIAKCWEISQEIDFSYDKIIFPCKEIRFLATKISLSRNVQTFRKKSIFVTRESFFLVKDLFFYVKNFSNAKC